MIKQELIFASSNEHKLIEVAKKMPATINLKSMKQAGYINEIEETGSTIHENAKIKADAVYDSLGKNCFADDTGLMVDALNGEPGVYSARYAGANCSYADNVNKLLDELKGKNNRNAHFSTVIALWWEGEYYEFEGRVDGFILENWRGNDGFGYDPIFLPNGLEMTFAEISLDEKNRISHRGLAMEKLIKFLS